MNRRRLKPLVWPVALLIAGGLTALLAEATTRSVETVTLYGMVKLVSDLVLLIGAVWLIFGLVRVARLAKR
ncbi:hypothetical protein [Brevundimonas sp.]|uniref:hypothetical protein n=1 Tax=Brevundimonas sp. TaxID=1871086 RepID=UPI00286CD9BC|nr:hypothetical protein [Brevundimonas sp.]